MWLALAFVSAALLGFYDTSKKASLKDNAVLLASGIIAERCDDVVECFERNGFKVVEKLTDNDWCGLAVMKA